MKIFEIHDITTHEILSDRLPFEEVPELFEAYANFYPSHEIAFCERIEEDVIVSIYTSRSFNRKTEFHEQWAMLVAANLCNFY
jgi:hypothetical protein